MKIQRGEIMKTINLIELHSVYWNLPEERNQREILHNINLNIQEGDFVSIMGPTGCGKTIFLKLLAGLINVSDGIYLYKGQSIVNGLSKSDLADVGIAYQSDSLFEWLTVEKNIKQPIKILGMKNKYDQEERINQILDLVGLKNYRDCYPHELSGGMRQRCAFGRAVVNYPGVLFLDQPFGALDAITRKMLGTELLKMWKEEKKTVIMITNNVTEALMLSNKVVVLSNAPATVAEEIAVNIPYEERFEGLRMNEEYIKLSKKLNKLVRNDNSQERR